MERRKALAAATAATFVLGSGIVAAASMTGTSILGFGGGAKHSRTSSTNADSAKPGVVVKTRNIYDRYVVTTGDDATTGTASDNRNAGGSSGSTDSALAREPTAADPGREPAAGDSPPTSNAPAARPGTRRSTPTTARATTPTTAAHGVATPPTTAAPTPTTVPSPTTTWPRGVPSDWPKDKPIPPMPPNCREPQLEDNGVWNCDH
jgi:hypothetical protein